MRAPDRSPARGRLALGSRAVQANLGFEQISHHGRDQRPGQQIRREHGEHDRHGERREQISGGPREQEHGDEHDTNRNGGNEGRDGDLRSPVEHGADQRLAHGDVAVRVLDLDGSVIHQNADGEGQTAEGHHIDGFSEKAQNTEGRQDRKRNGNAHDQRAAPASEKQQDHQPRERGRYRRFARDAEDGGAHKNRLIRQGYDFQFRRNVGEDSGERRLYRIDNGESRGLAVPGDGNQNAAGSVGAHDVVLDRIAVVDLRHVLHVDCGAVHRFDRQIVQIVEQDRAAVYPDLILGLGELGGSGGQNQVLQVQGVGDVDGRELPRVEFVGIEVDHNATLFAAERIRYRSTLDGAERSTDEVIGNIEDFLLAEGLAGKAELQDGNAGGIVLQNVG